MSDREAPCKFPPSLVSVSSCSDFGEGKEANIAIRVPTANEDLSLPKGKEGSLLFF